MESDEMRPNSLSKLSTDSDGSQSRAKDAVDDEMQGKVYVIQSSSSSFLEVAMDYINTHLRAFRTVPWVMGGLGAILVIRYSGMFTRYHSARDIPSRLLAHNTTLRGAVAGVKPDCCLDVWHVPTGRQWLRWGHRPPKQYSSDQVLKVRLAAISIVQPETTCHWLRSNLTGRTLWFRLLSRSPSDQSLYCIVRHRKRLFHRKVCVNTELLSQGLATFEEAAHGFHSNKQHSAFLRELGRAEEIAKRRGEGVWKGSEYESWWRRVARTLRLRN